MKILFLTKYSYAGASSRYCYHNYFTLLSKQNVSCSVSPFFNDEYIKHINRGKQLSTFKFLSYCFRRIFALRNIFRYDLLVIEYELIPYFPNIFERIIKFLGCKYIVGYDDAIFHNYDLNPNPAVRYLLSNKIKNVIKNADGVVTGSPYLTDYAKQYHDLVVEIPTSVDNSKYEERIVYKENEPFVIGWIGSKSTSIYLLNIIPALKSFASRHNCEIRLIGFDQDLTFYFEGLPVTFIDWNEQTEVEEICKFSVGVMPLSDNQWSRGKCGFKLVQYMACAKPTISTPLPANIKINKNGKNLHACTNHEWYEAFLHIFQNQTLYREIGMENKLITSQSYSTQINYKLYLDLFHKLIH
jgi:glycosyltransferase involved in cell wall biosynthesis